MRTCSEEKKNKIKQTMAETKEKRACQVCKVFPLKVVISHLNKSEQEILKMFFVEAKWLYNHILSTGKPFEYDYKNKKVVVLNKDRESEERTLKYLPAKNRQDVLKTLQCNIRGLSARKKKGGHVGKLRYKSEYNSIELSQYGVTHKIAGRNRIKINGLKRPLIVRGLDQIKPYYEIGDAKLIKKPSGYYIHLTCYKSVSGSVAIKKKNESTGLDFGIKTTITTSAGEKYNISIGESKRLNALQKKLHRRVKGSKNRYKILLALRREYEHIVNQRRDKANKIVSELLRNNEIIYMQDENIKGWHKGLFGKQVQNSALGTIKSKLEQSGRVIMLDRNLPTTKWCHKCGNIVDISLSDRIFTCNVCGYSEDRDIKSAKTVKYIGKLDLNKNSVPVEYRELTPVEIVPLPEGFQPKASTVREAGTLRIYS
ncbi:MAG: transposase [Candidatus Eremiobacterota bacterium]